MYITSILALKFNLYCTYAVVLSLCVKCVENTSSTYHPVEMGLETTLNTYALYIFAGSGTIIPVRIHNTAFNGTV